MYDLEKMTERGRRTKIKLNIDPPLYGRCCYNRFDPVGRDSHVFIACTQYSAESILSTDVAVYVTDNGVYPPTAMTQPFPSPSTPFSFCQLPFLPSPPFPDSPSPIPFLPVFPPLPSLRSRSLKSS